MEHVSEIKERLRQLKPRLEDSYGVDELAVFGSCARNEATEDSDIDILVSFSEPIGLFDLMRLEDEIARVLERDVDLVTDGSLKPRIGERIADDLIYV